MATEGTCFFSRSTGRQRGKGASEGGRDGICSLEDIELDLGDGQEIVSGHDLK